MLSPQAQFVNHESFRDRVHRFAAIEADGDYLSAGQEFEVPVLFNETLPDEPFLVDRGTRARIAAIRTERDWQQHAQFIVEEVPHDPRAHATRARRLRAVW